MQLLHDFEAERDDEAERHDRHDCRDPGEEEAERGSTVVAVRVPYSIVVMFVVMFSAVVSATVVMSPTLPPR